MTFIDSIARVLQFNSNTKGVFDPDGPLSDKTFAFYSYDTITKTLIVATVYTYTKKVKILTNFHFYNNKVIRTFEYRVPIKDQMNQKYAKLRRTNHYWQDELIYSSNETGKSFDFHTDLETGKEVLRRFDKIEK